MKARFEGENFGQLIRALKAQQLVAQDDVVAQAIAKAGTVQEFAIGENLMTQDAPDNDVYFLLSGAVAIVIHGANVATRRAGETVGEMSAIEPALPRAATVTAMEHTVALQVSNNAFLDLAESHPKIWMTLAQALAKRLHQRNETIARPNASPKLFIISSSEAADIAHGLRTGLERAVFSTVWDKGVFWAGGYPLEALERQVTESDFAVAVTEPDDVVETRGVRARTLRDNVLFELGLFMGKLTRHRSILLCPNIKDLRLPSDLQGLTVIFYHAGAAPLEQRLESACEEVRAVIQRLGVKVFGRT